MFNHEQSADWNKKWKIDWNTERMESYWNGYNCSRSEYPSGQSFVVCNGLPYEYGGHEKNNCFAEYGFGGSYPSVYQACSEDDWLGGCTGCGPHYASSVSPYPPHNYQQPHRSAYWSKYAQQPPQPPNSGAAMSANYPSNMTAGTSAIATTAGVADPLNALQNLTVSAGQSAQMVTNPRLNSTAYNSPMRQRLLVQGPINRPIESLGSTKSPLSQQMMSSQMPSNVVISNSSMVNTGSIRIPNNTMGMKPEMCMNQNAGPQSLMLPPYPMESCNTMMNNQQSISMPSSGKLAQYNTPMMSQFQSSKDQYSLSSQSSSSIPYQTGNPAKRPLPSASNQRTQSIISEEEAKKVREEIKRLKDKYFKKLTLFLETPKNCAEDNKVWFALKNILDNPDSIPKPLTLKHVQKIEEHLLKVEQHMIYKGSSDVPNTQSEKQISNISQTGAQNQNSNASRTVIPKAVANYDEPLMKKSQYPMSNSSSDNVDMNSGSINSSSLDIAFDDVCHQLTETNEKVVQNVQKNLIEYVKSRQTQYRHFLPKRVFIDLDEENNLEEVKFKRQRMDSTFTDEEFSMLKPIEIEDINPCLTKDPDDVVDENRLLRLDLDFSHININLCNLESELRILESEFHITKLEDQKMSKDWFSYDPEWNDSQFFALAFKNQYLPSPVPSIKVRISSDYEDSGYTDWNLNLDLYQTNSDDFLKEVSKILSINFTETHHNYQWSGVPLVYVMSLYKRSIMLAYSNQIDRIGVN